MSATTAREKADAAEKARAALLAALDPHGDVDYGLAVAITWQLDDDAAAVLAELVDKRVAAERERAVRTAWSLLHRSPDGSYDGLDPHNEAVEAVAASIARGES